MKDKEKLIKYKMYLEAEKIRLAKAELRKLKVELNDLNKQKELSRRR